MQRLVENGPPSSVTRKARPQRRRQNFGHRSSACRRTGRRRGPSRRSGAATSVAPVGLGDAGGFRRQRPSFADIPVRPLDAVPVHLVRPNAAQEHRDTAAASGSAPARRAARGRCSRAADRRRTRPARGRRGSSTSPLPAIRAAAATAGPRAIGGIASPTHVIGRRRSNDCRAIHGDHRRARG